MSSLLLLADGPNLLWPLFHVRRTQYDAMSTEAVIASAIRGLIGQLRALCRTQEATHCIVVFEGGDGGRRSLWPTYKSGRKRPEGTETMMEQAISALNADWFCTLHVDGYEADDVIGSIVRALANSDHEICIVSDDKDLCCLVGGPVYIWSRREKRVWTATDVEAKFGVPPHRMPDYLALVGDSSDNIPGGKGIGHKRALQLLDAYSSLDALLDACKGAQSGAERLVDCSRDSIVLSRDLVSLRNCVSCVPMERAAL